MNSIRFFPVSFLQEQSNESFIEEYHNKLISVYFILSLMISPVVDEYMGKEQNGNIISQWSRS
jgi:hypothetical protein